jgi:exosome complex RNA-binding protein Csl4
MSQLEVDKVIPQSGTTLTLGDSADTITIPSGATLDASNATLTLPDGSVTAAKLDSTAVDNTNTNSTVITGQTAETSIDGADSILIYDDSATALRKMTRTNFVAGIGGTNTPAFLAYRTTAQSLISNTDTKVQWNTEDFDIGSCYDNVTNYRFTPNVAGKYVITHCLTVNNSTGVNVDASFVEIHKNGSTAYPSIYRQGLNAVSANLNFNEISFCVTKIFDMNGTTDYVEAYVHAAGADLQTDASSNEVGFFSGYKLIE